MLQGTVKKFLAKLSIMAIAGTTAITAAQPAQAIPGSVNGRYQGLIQAMYCPEAQPDYGFYNQYGYWEGGEYICGDQYARAGYWVYSFPNWYVWGYDTAADNSRDQAEETAATTNDVNDDPTSAYGDYRDLVQVFSCPDAQNTYGEYFDYGYWEGGEWCAKEAAAGYLVYSSPNWYVWNERDGENTVADNRLDLNSPLLIEDDNTNEDVFIDPNGEIPLETIDSSDGLWLDSDSDVETPPADNIGLDSNSPLLLETDDGEAWIELEEEAPTETIDPS